LHATLLFVASQHKKELKAHIDTLPKDVFIMLKLSIPTQTDLYKDFIEHPQVLRVVAECRGQSEADVARLTAENTRRFFGIA